MALQLLKVFTKSNSEDKAQSVVISDESSFIVSIRPTEIVCIDRALEKFFEIIYANRGVEVRQGSPRDKFSHPSIYIEVPTVQVRSFLGQRLGHSSSSDKLTITDVVDADGNKIANLTDIANHDAVVDYRGNLAIANARITVYTDNFDVTQELLNEVYSLIIHNVPYYIHRISQYNDTVPESKDPKIAGLEITGIYEKFHDELCGAKHIWAVTVGAAIPYFIRVSKYYTYITGIHETAYIVDPITDEKTLIHEHDI
jgi:hypothetical protein